MTGLAASRRSARTWNRRHVLRAGAALAPLPFLLGRSVRAWSSDPVRLPDDPFQLGVASGDPLPRSVVLWTRLAPKPLDGGGMPPSMVPVRWEVATDDSMRKVVQKGTALATPQLAHAVHVEVEGLEPDRWYWYRFTCGDAQSPVGRTRTAPALGAMPERLRFAFASCQHYEQGLFTAYEHMAREEDLDLVVHLGDYIYDGAGQENRVRRHIGPELQTLEHYRTRYAQYRSDPLLRGMHALCPWVAVTDDHEVDNNYAGAISDDPDVDPLELLARRANAYQAYYEHMPLRRRSLPHGPDMRLYRQIAWGRLARFQMLDTRQYRTDQPNGDGNKPLEGGALDPHATLLGDRQERWLMRSLLDSPAVWNVLGQQVMMARVDRAPGEEARFSMDQWPGYEMARQRLVQFVAERRIPNPVVLAGDIHTNWVNDLKVDFDRQEDPVVATEFVGTSIASGGNGTARPRNLDAILSENPFVHYHNAQRGYVSCTVTPDEWRSDYRVLEYVDRPGSPIETGAAFVVPAGRPGAQRA